MRFLSIIVTMMVLQVVSATAFGSIIRFEYQAEVTAVAGDTSIFPHPIGVGDVVTGIYVFETRPASSLPLADYFFSGPQFGHLVRFESGWQFPIGDVRILVFNDSPNPLPHFVFEAYQVRSDFFDPNAEAGEVRSAGIRFLLYNEASAPAQPFSSSELPTTPPGLDDFANNEWFFGYAVSEGGSATVSGFVTEIRRVSEPPLLILIAIGALALVWNVARSSLAKTQSAGARVNRPEFQNG